MVEREDMCLRPTHGWTMDLAQLLECFALLSLYKYAKYVIQIQIQAKGRVQKPESQESSVRGVGGTPPFR